jgi:hypothetical protein
MASFGRFRRGQRTPCRMICCYLSKRQAIIADNACEMPENETIFLKKRRRRLWIRYGDAAAALTTRLSRAI